MHARVRERHPELSEADVRHARENYMVGAVRVPGEREARIGLAP